MGPSSTLQRRARDDVGERAILAVEVHVECEDVRDRTAHVTSQAERLEKHLGKDHGRAEIHEGPTFERTDALREDAEVAQARLADGRSVGTRVHVDDVGTERDVHGNRDAESGSRSEYAERCVREARVENLSSNGAAEPDSRGGALGGRWIEEAPRLLRHAKAAVG
jgi:hypothetical protein